MPKCTLPQSEVKPTSLPLTWPERYFHLYLMHTPNLLRRRGTRAAFASFCLALAALASAGCSDPFKLKAQYANEPFTYTLYSLSGKGPANAPSALDLMARATMKVDGNFSFDVAFDVNASGKIVVIPQKLVGTPISGSRVMYLQRLSGAYESVLEAPAHNWLADSTVTLVPGEVVGVKLIPSSCVYQISNDVYAKLVIDSVGPGGLLYGRGVLNPNCGFKSFADGVPEK